MQETNQVRQALERPGEDVLDGGDCELCSGDLSYFIVGGAGDIVPVGAMIWPVAGGSAELIDPCDLCDGDGMVPRRRLRPVDHAALDGAAPF